MYTRAPGSLSDNTRPDIDYFTNEPVVQCDAPVVKNIFVDDWYKIIKFRDILD